MLFKSKLFTCLFATAIVFGLSIAVLADTIRLKDGTIIKGKVIGFKDQQFIVVVGDGASRTSTRRSQMSLYIEDVESIEFDSNDGGTTNNNRVAENSTPVRNNDSATNNNNRTENTQSSSKPSVVVTSNLPQPREQKPSGKTSNQSGGLSQVINSQPTSPSNIPTSGTSSRGKFITLNVKVLADSTANGWTNAGYVVKKGQRVRISANGRVSLGKGHFATPAGVGSISDTERLMQTEPTGALIAVIGDDNNDFIFIGSSREFVAQRDGTLFLGINEGNLDDNSGAFDATIEIEAIDSTATSRR